MPTDAKSKVFEVEKVLCPGALIRVNVTFAKAVGRHFGFEVAQGIALVVSREFCVYEEKSDALVDKHNRWVAVVRRGWRYRICLNGRLYDIFSDSLVSYVTKNCPNDYEEIS